MRRGTKDIKYLGDIPPVVNQFGMTHQVINTFRWLSFRSTLMPNSGQHCH